MTIEVAIGTLEKSPSPLSGWMHAALALSLVAAQIAPLPLPGFSAISAAPADAQRNQQIQCYSQGNRPNSCDLPNGTQSVIFMGPDRSGRCQQGSTWQQRGNQLWVTGGCGGAFEATVYGGSGSGGGGWGGSGGSGSGSNQITCRSLNGRTERCQAYTGNRVQLIQQYSNSPCIEGRTWSYDRNGITVRDGCQARFALGGGSGGGSGGGWGGGNSGSGFAGTIECRSQGNRYQRCSINTQNRVQMIRQLSNTTCYQNRNWGYDRNSIWVDNGCSGQFGVGYGNDFGSGGNNDWNNGNSNNNSGTSAGEVIAGVALAGGLIALLAAAGRSSTPKSPSTAASAAIDADMQKFPSDARRDGQACLNEAARQIGVTGGSRIRLNEVDAAQRSGDGWMILARLSVTYDNQIKQITMDCRSTNGKVTAFDVR